MRILRTAILPGWRLKPTSPPRAAPSGLLGGRKWAGERKQMDKHFPPQYFFSLFFLFLSLLYSSPSHLSFMRVFSRIFKHFFPSIHITVCILVFLPLSRYLPTGELLSLFFLFLLFSGYYYVTWTPYQTKKS